MSSKKTSKLNLHAWEGTDAFRRDEFNENFKAIDQNAEATWAEVMKKADADDLTALESTVENKADKSTVTSLQSTVNGKVDTSTFNAALAVRPELVLGTYTGNGEASRTISLGFTPKALYLCRADGDTHFYSGNYFLCGGLVLPGHPLFYNTSTDRIAVQIVDGGFKVVYDNSQTNLLLASNSNNRVYHYIAFK